MKSSQIIPAAQYLRMSTDMQECSIENRAVAILLVIQHRRTLRLQQLQYFLSLVRSDSDFM